MDAAEAAEAIREVEEREEEKSRFSSHAAMAIAVLAMLLAITSLGGQNAMKEMLSAQVQATDQWSFYQAKNIRQNLYQVQAEVLEATLLKEGDQLSAPAKERFQNLIDKYKDTAARYEKERNEEIKPAAEDWEKKRNRAQAQDPNFDFAEALFQIAIVLGSVSIVARTKAVLGLCIAVGLVATLLMINGYVLLVPLPF